MHLTISANNRYANLTETSLIINVAIAAGEKRHELAYTRIMGKLFEIDPDGAVCACT